jgi:tetratricopeptide (TPR) repeat protein
VTLVHLDRGEPEEAFRIATSALDTLQPSEDRPYPCPVLTSRLQLELPWVRGLAQARTGDRDAAQATLAELKELADLLPGTIARQMFHHFAGELALERGDAQRAVAELERAQRLIPPASSRQFAEVSDVGDDMVLNALGRAYLAAGAPERAAAAFERILDLGYAGISHELAWGEYHYRLAVTYEQLGRDREARELYRRFLDIWGEGDLHPDWIETARRKVTS